MAGDWIKLEHATPDKPEIDQIASALGIDHDSAFGKCVRLWIWADQQSVDGHALSVTNAFLDRLVFCDGFANALRKVGWLEGRDSRLSIPNFCRHNGESAKKRALSKDRKKESRKRHAASVTKARPEKRREEDSLRESKPPNPLSRIEHEPLRKAAADWFAYKPKLKAESRNRAVSRMLNVTKDHGEQAVVDAIDRAIAQGYQGWDHGFTKPADKPAAGKYTPF